MRKLKMMSQEALATKMLERAGMDIRALNARTGDQAPETMAMVAEQGAEKTLKAILIARGARRIEGHHIHKMAEQLERHGEGLPAGIDKKDLEMLAETNMEGRFPDYDWDGCEPDYDKFFDIPPPLQRRRTSRAVFEIPARTCLARLRRERGAGVSPWRTHGCAWVRRLADNGSDVSRGADHRPEGVRHR